MIETINVKQVEDFATTRDRCVVIMGMLGCDPCKHLMQFLNQSDPFAGELDVGYCALRPSHMRAMISAGALASAPTTFVYLDGRDILSFEGGPTDARDEAFVDAWRARVREALATASVANAAG